MNIIRPKSPAIFKCLFAISSRKGTMTVHPFLAILIVRKNFQERWEHHTKSVDNVPPQETSCSKYSNGMSYTQSVASPSAQMAIKYLQVPICTVSY